MSFNNKDLMLETIAVLTVIIGRSSDRQKTRLKKVFTDNSENAIVLARCFNYPKIIIPTHQVILDDIGVESYIVDDEEYRFGWISLEKAERERIDQITGQLLLESSF